MRSVGIGVAVVAMLGGGVLVPAAVDGVPAKTAVSAQTPHSRALAAYARMTQTERVGQLLMVGIPSSGMSGTQRAALAKYGVGGVYLSGPSRASVTRVRAMTNKVHRQLRHDGVVPYISADHEGGNVQRFTGPGFSRVPTALAQGRMTTSKLRAAWSKWGKQLDAAGIDLNLAPVADTVPASKARSNQPIGRYQREYGYTPSRVSASVTAAVRGMTAGRTKTALKHFPGLGRATGNTDFAGRITDPTTRNSAYIRPYRAGVKAGSRFVMVSSATYPNIDAKHLACFSRTVMVSMLRGDLGFGGVIVSDSMGAAALSGLSKGVRATRFIGAGGTMVLSTSWRDAAPMSKALRTKSAADPQFAAKLKAAVLTVLEAKARDGLLTS